MVLPSAPTNLSAEATNETTAELRWSAPPTVSPPVTGYKIERRFSQILESIMLTAGGSGYTSTPTVTITGGGGSEATADAVLTGMSVSSFIITNSGNDYTSTPLVTITGGGGSGATGVAVLGTFPITPLVADTGSTETAFSDTTISTGDHPSYRVSAINTEGTGPTSDTASTTTSSSEAQTIQELLFNQWSLAGELGKVTTGDMTEPIHFFARGQVPGNKFAKAITVQKINEFGNENVVEHPKYFEESETFEITCFLQIIDSADDQFSVWIDLMQQMTSEVIRILKTVYAPSAGTGQFFRTTTGWTKDDTFLPDDPELTRTLRFVLSRIVSNSDEVFVGYPGVIGSTGTLVFDTSESDGDSLPIADYSYTQLSRVEIVQGWRNLPYITTDVPDTTAIPVFYRGAFSGRFTAIMDLKKSDITPNTLNSLRKIFLPQNNGELGTAVFLHNIGNTENPVTILQESIPVNITEVQKITENEQLVKFHLRGNLTGPTSIVEISFAGIMQYEDTGNMQYEDTTEMEYG